MTKVSSSSLAAIFEFSFLSVASASSPGIPVFAPFPMHPASPITSRLTISSQRVARFCLSRRTNGSSNGAELPISRRNSPANVTLILPNGFTLFVCRRLPLARLIGSTVSLCVHSLPPSPESMKIVKTRIAMPITAPSP